jgi:hypothetical protein
VDLQGHPTVYGHTQLIAVRSSKLRIRAYSPHCFFWHLRQCSLAAPKQQLAKHNVQQDAKNTKQQGKTTQKNYTFGFEPPPQGCNNLQLWSAKIQAMLA